MFQIIDQIQHMFWSLPDPAKRNAIALAVCMILFCVYLRARADQPGPRRRPIRTADSILRDVMVR